MSIRFENQAWHTFTSTKVLPTVVFSNLQGQHVLGGGSRK